MDTYGTVTYTNTDGKEYTYEVPTREAMIQDMQEIKAARAEGLVMKASFIPHKQPARAKQSFFGKPISKEQWLAMKGQG